MKIFTQSGSMYLYEGDTVTRLSEAPVANRHGEIVPADALASVVVLEATVPEVGRSWRFAVEDYVVTTSRVVALTL